MFTLNVPAKLILNSRLFSGWHMNNKGLRHEVSLYYKAVPLQLVNVH
jgi:hypothetical protein